MTATVGTASDIGFRESGVRSYSRAFPAVFDTAKDEVIESVDGTRYIDFLSGAGTLNYGHNPEVLKTEVLRYLQRDGITHGLDLATSAKLDFVRTFTDLILDPRGLDHLVQFCSPSGANTVEAALKLARLVTGRTNVVSFSGAFHGVSTGALAATSADYYRAGLHATLNGITRIPYPDSPLGVFDSVGLLARMLRDPNSGVEKPAAVLLETVQGEGGVYLAPIEFLRDLRALCEEFSMLLIVDDIQAGCGRSGPFFSFERAGIVPDLITLSKSIGGYGMPMSLLLLRPQFDIWRPGQHNGTFRGNQLAFVAAAVALRAYWSNDELSSRVVSSGRLVADRLRSLAAEPGIELRGLGLMWGLDLGGRPELPAEEVARRCFERGLIVETCGRGGQVLKILPPLTITEHNLRWGLDVIRSAVAEIAGPTLPGGRS